MNGMDKQQRSTYQGTRGPGATRTEPMGRSAYPIDLWFRVSGVLLEMDLWIFDMQDDPSIPTATAWPLVQ